MNENTIWTYYPLVEYHFLSFERQRIRQKICSCGWQCEDDACAVLQLGAACAGKTGGWLLACSVAASVDADVNVGSKIGCICELQLLQNTNSVLTQKKAV